jgi:glycosyltransferase involved in cell wall biosynthesis
MTTDPIHRGEIDSRAARRHAGPSELDLSVLIPVFNEVDNVEPLHAELDAVLRPLRATYELIFVDDGSNDGTAARLDAIQRRDHEHVRVVFLRRNCGQTAALSAALDLARGEILVPIDGDRQNDPADIPRLLEKLAAGYDVVSGWRKDRHDALLSRKVPSWIANRLVARVSAVPLHDFGCTLKAYRRHVLAGVRLYGEMHRFIPIFATWQGGRVTELVVNHRPRTAGRTKYGLSRTFHVLLDLILIRYLQRYAQRPLHFFGQFGLWSFGLGFLSFLAMLYYKYVFPWPYLWWGSQLDPKSFVETPLPLLTVMFFLAGGLSILLGIQSEVNMRTYYESQSKTTYLLREIRQGPQPAEVADAHDSTVDGDATVDT